MTLTKEEKKNIKSERVKSVFAETAKSIIVEQGIQEVSVRKVADMSGYSLRSIYNHFANLDELLWVTRQSMINDTADYFLNINTVIKSDDDLKELFKAFMDYFIERPNIFFFFYCYPLDKSVKTDEQNIMEKSEVKEKFAMTFQYLMDEKKYTPEIVGKITSTIIYCLYGMLTLYLSGNDELTLEQIYKQLGDIIDLQLSS